ncbi:MAG: hypothetical protein IKL89_04070 [Clostridia bacterium]|nr:hypothetical protein [Clostridia bacterium]
MNHTEQWIWLPESLYKNEQTTVYSGFNRGEADNYTVAEFQKTYVFPQKVIRAELRFCGDTAFQLFCNGGIVATGPACVGGDFLGNETVRDNFYAFSATLWPDSAELRFFARVQMLPVHICEYSKGHGGFMLSAILFFADGEELEIHTDESWLVRKCGAYTAPKAFDGRIPPDAFLPAECIPNIWNTETAPIPVRVEQELRTEASRFSLLPHEEKNFVLDFDRIWSGFLQVRTKARGELSLQLTCRELSEKVKPEVLIFSGDQEYRGFYMHSAGNIAVCAKNLSPHPAEVDISFVITHYPVYDEVDTVTDDAALNLVLQTCKHTLKICRQTHHLDSPRHCEPLACTGDYYIESLMTPFSFGDMRLAEFDLLRTAVMLERESGRMFHTTYSLIWVRMLRDVYMLTGNQTLLCRCRPALDLLFDRFAGYLGNNGILETPPDYMFVDWIYIDGISMHHPPKALGQSCLNMFYFGALQSAEEIYRKLGDASAAAQCHAKKEALRAAVNRLLFDPVRGCYFEGLNTPTEPHLIGQWMPQNVEKRYYLKHSNILAAYFGICDDDTARGLIHRIMSDDIAGDCQPYFQHYLLEAVFRLGLRKKYTLKICSRWKAPVQHCPKGLVEGFVAPEPTYPFDHSHAWGGTPLFSLPKALMGLEIRKPGMREISLSPALLGLSHASAALLTPFGKVVCEMKAGEPARITHPEQVRVILK